MAKISTDILGCWTSLSTQPAKCALLVSTDGNLLVLGLQMTLLALETELNSTVIPQGT